MSRSINISDQKEGQRDDKWQHESDLFCGVAVSRPIKGNAKNAIKDGANKVADAAKKKL
jgi:hypothetical protein